MRTSASKGRLGSPSRMSGVIEFSQEILRQQDLEQH